MFFSRLLKNTNLNFVKTHKIAFFISVVLIFFSFFSIITRGFNFGIGFSGGVLIEAEIKEKIAILEVRKVLSQEDFRSFNIQEVGENGVMIRVSPQDQVKDQTKTATKIKESLDKNFPNQFEYRKTDFVGPQVGAELIKKGVMALVISFTIMMFYIWVRFDWQFGVGAVLALVHDVILTMGLFSFIQLEFDLTSIAAILTIVGYSVNDSVVIYDRIREYLRKYKKKEIEEILNLSINSTLSRTILTAGSTIVALLALVFLGGEVLRSFSIAVLFGVIIGTYSSIYISAPVLLYMKITRDGKKSSKK
ncbi:protein translocase subunit SecF [Pseudomonadota bacterium]